MPIETKGINSSRDKSLFSCFEVNGYDRVAHPVGTGKNAVANLVERFAYQQIKRLVIRRNAQQMVAVTAGKRLSQARS